MGGGGFFAPFVPVDKGGGYVECPRLSNWGGEGGKIGSKLVHVVVECPLRWDKYLLFFFAVKNVQTKVALMQEAVLKVLVCAVHVREFKNHFLVFVPTNMTTV